MAGRILVVDDDADVRRVFATVLRQRYEVVEAAGGAAALEALASTPFRLVVLDLHMPNVDGFAVLEQLAEMGPPNQDVPVIMVTADGTDTARARALKAHGVYFLSKPVPIRVLSSLVDSTIERLAEVKRSGTPPKP